MLPSDVERIELIFAPGVKVKFADRLRAIKYVIKLGERGSRLPLIIYGPEGCGKSALLRQSYVVLRKLGYEVLYIDPLSDLSRGLECTLGLKEVVFEVLKSFTGDLSIALVKSIFTVASKLMKLIKGVKLALLLDDVFQVIGLGSVESYVKQALNLIEYPPEPYERVLVMIASSEGLSREYLSRHSWSSTLYMWNMSRGGFEELYTQVPSNKPDVSVAWGLSGGNPRMLSILHTHGWDVSKVISEVVGGRSIRSTLRRFSREELKLLKEAVNDPDILWRNLPDTNELLKVLIEMNLVSEIPERNEDLWIDELPNVDKELGIGEYIAWQTPIHKEAMKKVLNSLT